MSGMDIRRTGEMNFIIIILSKVKVKTILCLVTVVFFFQEKTEQKERDGDNSSRWCFRL